MIYMNIKGLGTAHKIRFVKGLIRQYNTYLILFQETMISKENSWEAMLSICSEWYVCTTRAFGLSRGLGIMWNPNKTDLKPTYVLQELYALAI